MMSFFRKVQWWLHRRSREDQTSRGAGVPIRDSGPNGS